MKIEEEFQSTEPGSRETSVATTKGREREKPVAARQRQRHFLKASDIRVASAFETPATFTLCLQPHGVYRTWEKKCIHLGRLHRLQPLQPSTAFLASALSRPRSTLMHLRVNAVTTESGCCCGCSCSCTDRPRARQTPRRASYQRRPIYFLSTATEASPSLAPEQCLPFR